jgi:hypothetical protein
MSEKARAVIIVGALLAAGLVSVGCAPNPEYPLKYSAASRHQMDQLFASADTKKR